MSAEIIDIRSKHVRGAEKSLAAPRPRRTPALTTPPTENIAAFIENMTILQRYRPDIVQELIDFVADYVTNLSKSGA
jgi:hypothetical protein